ncbi:phosphotransferase [Leptospira sp. 96542]|nr:phosphotransferase [Leptospira sp. 96542]
MTYHLNLEQTEFLKKRYNKDLHLVPLQEEASTRKYFQIKTKSEIEVLCVDQTVNEDFIKLSEFLFNEGIRVPRIFEVESKLGLIFMSFEGLEDFGTYSLDEYKEKFPNIIDLILKLQTLDPPNFVKERKFDTEKLGFEVNLTIEKFQLFAKEYNLRTTISNEAIAFLDETVAYLNVYPINVFTHRDFHCRNLLRNEHSMMSLIDFQDARMGVPQYDLASILYDAYYPLPRDFRMQMLRYYQSKSIDQSKKFMEVFYLQTLQRSFKALGTYFRMVTDQKKEKFKPSILKCLNQLEDIIQLGMFADSLYIFIRSLRNELNNKPEFKNYL